MPQPKYHNSESSEEINNFSFDIFKEPVEEFQEPEKEIEDEIIYNQELNGLENDDQEEDISPQKRRARAKKNARNYVKMASTGFASLAAAYADADSEEFLIDEDEQSDIADPLSDVIYERQIIDLPPGWMVVIFALIAFFPMIIKAINLRKDNKALKEAESKIIELKEKVKKEETKEKEEPKNDE
jgi:hypothetical protein